MNLSQTEDNQWLNGWSGLYWYYVYEVFYGYVQSVYVTKNLSWFIQCGTWKDSQWYKIAVVVADGAFPTSSAALALIELLFL